LCFLFSVSAHIILILILFVAFDFCFLSPDSLYFLCLCTFILY
jgi:hypothetical protein